MTTKTNAQQAYEYAKELTYIVNEYYDECEVKEELEKIQNLLAKWNKGSMTPNKFIEQAKILFK